ncbi:site-specific integrase [Helicobacter pylori]|uniref:tyrosine-type recombinase/integrase n=1 Tax=Helicobacter pylori TaxID=210 RepID=UPI000FDEF260|nr:site-specific integrase [Helicobacter pylori]MCH4610768.1 site-specific integrase [Helicobacter pylori]RVZ86634.1 site-specific integrase [Helicobacter pylori]
MSDCKMSRVSRELFDNIKSFLHHKLKTMIRIQSVNDLQLVLKWQDRVLECQSLIALKELNRKLYNQGIRHTIMMQGLFLFFEYFDNRIKLKSLHNLAEEQVIDFLFGLAKNRKPSSMAKKETHLPKHLNKNDFKAFIQALLKYHPKTSFEKRNQCILLLIVLGGLRKFEALDLELKNIALENNHYRLLIKGKNNKERYAYIEKEFLQVPLNAWLSDTKRLKSFKGRFVFKKAKNNTTQKTCSLKGFIAKIFKLSNIDVKSYGLGLHLFRHSFATFIYDETQDLVLTSRALGHSSLLSTKIYIHTTQEHNKKVALVLGGLLRNEKSE